MADVNNAIFHQAQSTTQAGKQTQLENCWNVKMATYLRQVLMYRITSTPSLSSHGSYVIWAWWVGSLSYPSADRKKISFGDIHLNSRHTALQVTSF
jgi:hypothetical protein